MESVLLLFRLFLESAARNIDMIKDDCLITGSKQAVYIMAEMMFKVVSIINLKKNTEMN